MGWGDGWVTGVLAGRAGEAKLGSAALVTRAVTPPLGWGT